MNPSSPARGDRRPVAARLRIVRVLGIPVRRGPARRDRIRLRRGNVRDRPRHARLARRGPAALGRSCSTPSLPAPRSGSRSSAGCGRARRGASSVSRGLAVGPRRRAGSASSSGSRSRVAIAVVCDRALLDEPAAGHRTRTRRSSGRPGEGPLPRRRAGPAFPRRDARVRAGRRGRRLAQGLPAPQLAAPPARLRRRRPHHELREPHSDPGVRARGRSASRRRRSGGSLPARRGRDARDPRFAGADRRRVPLVVRADGMVALGLLCATDCFLRRGRDGAAALVADGRRSRSAFLAWSKHEGAMLAALAPVLVLVFARRRALAWLAPPVAIVALTWAINHWFGFRNDLVQEGTEEGTVWSRLLLPFGERGATVASWFWRDYASASGGFAPPALSARPRAVPP